jgi:hypothetical protein
VFLKRDVTFTNLACVTAEEHREDEFTLGLHKSSETWPTLDREPSREQVCHAIESLHEISTMTI